MDRQPDYGFYLFWAGVVALGALFAALDRRWIKRPILGLVLIAGVPGGFVIMQASPFNFADGGYYMEGVLLSAGSALALIGYALAALGLWAGRAIGRRLS
jgi:hypothetical protein